MGKGEITPKQKVRDEKIKQRKEFLKAAECSKCHNPIPGLLQSSDFEPKRIDGKQVCDDCWFEALGDEVEKHPIGHPGRFHG